MRALLHAGNYVYVETSRRLIGDLRLASASSPAAESRGGSGGDNDPAPAEGLAYWMQSPTGAPWISSRRSPSSTDTPARSTARLAR
eukprot:9473627-Pyramimonas_sp.AAC.1